MPIINVPGQGDIEFPEGMSDDDIAQAIRKNFPDLAPKKEPTPFEVADTALGMVGKAGQMLNLGKTAQDSMNWDAEMARRFPDPATMEEETSKQFPPTLSEKIGSAITEIPRAAANTIATQLKGGAVAREILNPMGDQGFTGVTPIPMQLAALASGQTRSPEQLVVDIDKSGLMGAGRKLEGAVDSALPVDPALSRRFMIGQVPQGIGSTLGFMATAPLGPGAIASAGSLAGAGSGFEEALNAGATPDQVLANAGWNALAGSTEAVPISRLLKRLDKVSGGSITKAIVDMLKQGAEEGAQEVFQQTVSNAAAKYGFDPDRKLWDNLVESGGVGVITGALLAGGGHAIKAGHTALNQPPPIPPPTRFQRPPAEQVQTGLNEAVPVSAFTTTPIDDFISSLAPRVTRDQSQSGVSEAIPMPTGASSPIDQFIGQARKANRQKPVVPETSQEEIDKANLDAAPITPEAAPKTWDDFVTLIKKSGDPKWSKAQIKSWFQARGIPLTNETASSLARDAWGDAWTPAGNVRKTPPQEIPMSPMGRFDVPNVPTRASEVSPEQAQAGMTDTVQGEGQTPVDTFMAGEKAKPKDAVSVFEQALSGNERLSNKHSTAAGLGVKSVQDLTRLAEIRKRYAKEREALMAKLEQTPREQQMTILNQVAVIGFKEQLAREAIETATNAGSWVESPNRKLGKRPLDWQANKDAAEWLKTHGAEMQISIPEELTTKLAPVAKPAQEETVALYHGEGGADGAGLGGSHVSERHEYAATFGPKQSVVSVPRSVYEKMKAEAVKRGQPDDLILPNDWAKKLKPVDKPIAPPVHEIEDVEEVEQPKTVTPPAIPQKPVATPPPVPQVTPPEIPKPTPSTETAAEQKSSFDTKQAKQQKKFLLSEIGKALDEAPDAIAEGWMNDELKADSARIRDPETHARVKEDVLEDLFQKYNIPTELPGSSGDTMTLAGTPGVWMNPVKINRIDALEKEIEKRNTALKPHVTISVPDDGTFSILNNKEALKAFQEKASKFPTAAPRGQKPSHARDSATKPVAIGKLDKENTLRATELYKSTDPERKAIQYAFGFGDVVTATDGRRMIVVPIKLGGTPKNPTLLNDSGSPVKNPDPENIKIPDYQAVMPSYQAFLFSGVDTERLAVALVQAISAKPTKGESGGDVIHPVILHRNPDGSFGISLSINENAYGGYRHNIQEGSKKVAALNPDYLLDAVNAARILGDSHVDIGTGGTETWRDPIIIRGSNSTHVVMPMNLSGNSIMDDSDYLSRKDVEDIAAGNPVRTRPSNKSKKPGKAKVSAGGAQGAVSVPPVPTVPGSTLPVVPIKSISQIIRDLAKGLNVPIRFGRLTTSKFAGYFKPRPNLIGMAKANDIRIVNHEVGHKLDDMFKFSSMPVLVPELDALGDPRVYGAASSWTKSKPLSYKYGEGVAEFLRYWMEDTAIVQKIAPNTLAQWENVLDTYPDIGAVMRQAKSDYALYKQASPIAQFRSHIVSGSGPVNIQKTLSGVVRDTVDDLHFIKLMVEDAKKKGNVIAPGKDPYMLSRLLRGTFGMADSFVRKGTADFTTREVQDGTNLQDILAPVSNNLTEFTDYITAMRARELMTQGKATPFTSQQIKAVLDAHAGNTVFEQTFARVKEWNNAILKYAVDAGLLNADSAAVMQKMNEDYVPFHRFFEVGANELGSQGTGTGRGLNVGTPGSLKRSTGSARDVMNPLETMVKNAYSIITAAEKNHINISIADLAEGKDMGRYVERVKRPVVATKFELQEIREQLEDAGADLEDLDDDMLLIFFKGGNKAPFGENIIKVNRGGTPEFYRVDRDIFETIHALDYEIAGMVIKMLSNPAQLLRAGVTLMPDFAVANITRDTFSSAILSRYDTVPFYHTLRGMAHILGLGNSKLVSEWQASGGQQAIEATYFDADKIREMIRQKVTKDLTPAERAMFWAKSPLLALRILTTVLEESTRVGQYEAVLKANLKKGMAIGDARRLAAFEARDLQDFAKGGASTKSLRMLVPFSNAQLQGNVRLWQAIKERPLQTMAKGFAYITIPKLIEQAVNWDDDDYWNRPQWERDLFFLFPYGKDELGHTKFIRVPTPFEVGVIFGTFPGRIMQWMKQNDPGAMKGFPALFAKQTVPNPIPQWLLSMIEVASGTQGFSQWRGRPIVPTGLADEAPELQFTEQTSLTARKVGNMLKLSPAKIDYIINGTTGGVGKTVVHQGIDRVISAMTGEERTAANTVPGGRFVTTPAGVQSASVEQFYKELTKAREDDSRLKAGLKTSGDYLNLATFERTAKRIGKLRQFARETQNPLEKQRLYLQMQEEAKSALP